MRSATTTVLITLILTASACSDGVQPGDTADEGPVRHEGSIDPQDGSFVLQEIETGDAPPIRLQLVGRGLEVDAEASTVRLEVALRNASDMELYPRLNVWLSEFRPEGVMPINADLWPPIYEGPVDPSLAGYVYSGLVGEDGILSPGEDSEFKEWIFYDETLEPFRFATEVVFSLRPAGAVLAGTVFNDADGDGNQGPDEAGFGAGVVFVDGPETDTAAVMVGPMGHYDTTVTEPGLYTLRYLPPPTLSLIPIAFTTPNPLEVVLTPGPDGMAQSFRDAHFGVRTELPVPAVEITDRSADDIASDPYTLGDAAIEGFVLSAEVGFSGCGEEHPFTLYMADGEFMESDPVQATLVLSHDDLDELCPAYFQRRVLFDLTPIVRLYRDRYGDAPEPGGDVIILELRGPGGAVQDLRFEF